MSIENSREPSASNPLFPSVAAFARRVALGGIALYQTAVSPLLGPHCRFFPSCSAYAVQSIERHGLLVGAWRSLRRIARCHPFHPGGFDPVP